MKTINAYKKKKQLQTFWQCYNAEVWQKDVGMDEWIMEENIPIRGENIFTYHLGAIIWQLMDYKLFWNINWHFNWRRNILVNRMQHSHRLNDSLQWKVYVNAFLSRFSGSTYKARKIWPRTQS